MTTAIDPTVLAKELIQSLFDAPGHFKITLIKDGDTVEVLAGQPKDFMTLREVADYFGVTPQTIRRKYLYTGRLVRSRLGYRFKDVEALKHE